jgi:hypothetical protein
MVVTFLFPTVEMGVLQDLMASSSKCTVQAPHSACPQPNLVPFIESKSLKTQSSGMSGSAVTSCFLPLTDIVNFSMVVGLVFVV